MQGSNRPEASVTDFDWLKASAADPNRPEASATDLDRPTASTVRNIGFQPVYTRFAGFSASARPQPARGQCYGF
ncbi:MAG: hypothetical protein AAFR61_17785 [Bacteroidota bacterium]